MQSRSHHLVALFSLLLLLLPWALLPCASAQAPSHCMHCSHNAPAHHTSHLCCSNPASLPTESASSRATLDVAAHAHSTQPQLDSLRPTLALPLRRTCAPPPHQRTPLRI